MKRNLRLTGPLAAALTKVYPNQQPGNIVRSLASAVLRDTGVKSSGPPFDPFQCARALGVQVSYEAIEAEAVFCAQKTAEPRIILQRPSGKVTASYLRRVNFTLAHELGHFVIRSTLLGFFPVSRFSDIDGDEEFLCNLFAEELLMPSGLIANDLKVDGLTPDSLINLSDRYAVSLKSLLCRTTSLARGRVASALWTQRSGAYVPAWTSPNSFRRVVLCDTGRTTVERAFNSNKSESGRDHMILDGKRMKWSAVSKLLMGSKEVLTIMCRDSESPYRFVPPRREPVTDIDKITKICGPTQPLLPFHE